MSKWVNKWPRPLSHRRRDNPHRPNSRPIGAAARAQTVGLAIDRKDVVPVAMPLIDRVPVGIGPISRLHAVQALIVALAGRHATRGMIEANHAANAVPQALKAGRPVDSVGLQPETADQTSNVGPADRPDGKGTLAMNNATNVVPDDLKVDPWQICVGLPQQTVGQNSNAGPVGRRDVNGMIETNNAVNAVPDDLKVDPWQTCAGLPQQTVGQNSNAVRADLAETKVGRRVLQVEGCRAVDQKAGLHHVSAGHGRRLDRMVQLSLIGTHPRIDPDHTVSDNTVRGDIPLDTDHTLPIMAAGTLAPLHTMP